MRAKRVITLRRGAMLLVACIGMLMIGATGTTLAQLCAPCAAGGTYRISLGPTWHVRLSNPSLSVDVQNQRTGAVTTQVTSNMMNGQTYTKNFPLGTDNYGITNMTLTTDGGTIYGIYCDPSGYVTYPIGNPTLCVRITVTSGPSPHCYTINLNLVQPVGGVCPSP